MESDTGVSRESDQADSVEIFIREALRPDLTTVFGQVKKKHSTVAILIDDPAALIRFSSCKESSTDGKEDKKNKEIGKDDKGLIGAQRSPSGPVTDVSALGGSIVPPGFAASAQSNALA